MGGWSDSVGITENHSLPPDLQETMARARIDPPKGRGTVDTTVTNITPEGMVRSAPRTENESFGRAASQRREAPCARSGAWGVS